MREWGGEGRTEKGSQGAEGPRALTLVLPCQPMSCIIYPGTLYPEIYPDAI